MSTSQAILPCLLVTALSLTSANAAELTGAGASLPAPVYQKWSEAYRNATNNTINYQSIGSGGGIKEASGKSIDFGATDIPLSSADLQKHKLVQFPALIGGAVPIVNLPGIKSGEVRLNAQVLGDIYLGKITRWNDPAIRALNSTRLPDLSIAVVHRGDGAGTTWVFTDYLSKAHPQWQAKVGSGTTVTWPLGLHAKGDEGMTGFVKKLPGAIGYVDFAWARKNQLDVVQMQNKAGNFVAPEDANLKAAAAEAGWEAAEFGAMLTDLPARNAWPITGATFIVMQRQTDKPAVAKDALQFFKWALKNGYAQVESNGYVPLPERTVEAVMTSWQRITDTNGKPVLSN
ncbi:phosphate ABC transporter substrate-binding protein PstS [Viridibacterium curvum]|uniref:Phosphate-binding protein PstS n=1 Tax=Viridibacterium curvum TaxID=1101404 RepID=A0ABP9QT48_9RHOO